MNKIIVGLMICSGLVMFGCDANHRTPAPKKKAGAEGDLSRIEKSDVKYQSENLQISKDGAKLLISGDDARVLYRQLAIKPIVKEHKGLQVHRKVGSSISCDLEPNINTPTADYKCRINIADLANGRISAREVELVKSEKGEALTEDYDGKILYVAKDSAAVITLSGKDAQQLFAALQTAVWMVDNFPTAGKFSELSENKSSVRLGDQLVCASISIKDQKKNTMYCEIGLDAESGAVTNTSDDKNIRKLIPLAFEGQPAAKEESVHNANGKDLKAGDKAKTVKSGKIGYERPLAELRKAKQQYQDLLAQAERRFEKAPSSDLKSKADEEIHFFKKIIASYDQKIQEQQTRKN